MNFLIFHFDSKLKLEEAERKEKSNAKQVIQQKKNQSKNQAQNKKEQAKQPTTQSKQTKPNKQQADKVIRTTKASDAPKGSANDDDSKDSDESWEKDFDLNEK